MHNFIYTLHGKSARHYVLAVGFQEMFYHLLASSNDHTEPAFEINVPLTLHAKINASYLLCYVPIQQIMSTSNIHILVSSKRELYGCQG